MKDKKDIITTNINKMRVKTTSLQLISQIRVLSILWMNTIKLEVKNLDKK